MLNFVHNLLFYAVSYDVSNGFKNFFRNMMFCAVSFWGKNSFENFVQKVLIFAFSYEIFLNFVRNMFW